MFGHGFPPVVEGAGGLARAVVSGFDCERYFGWEVSFKGRSLSIEFLPTGQLWVLSGDGVVCVVAWAVCEPGERGDFGVSRAFPSRGARALVT